MWSLNGLKVFYCPFLFRTHWFLGFIEIYIGWLGFLFLPFDHFFFYLLLGFRGAYSCGWWFGVFIFIVLVSDLFGIRAQNVVRQRRVLIRTTLTRWRAGQSVEKIAGTKIVQLFDEAPDQPNNYPLLVSGRRNKTASLSALNQFLKVCSFSVPL